MVMVFGMGFAYWGHNWIFHGLFIAGLTLVFAAGVLLTIALWPWDEGIRRLDPGSSRPAFGVDAPPEKV
jgi:hypothetical protein